MAGREDSFVALAAARSDAAHYHAERAREEKEVREKAKVEAQEVTDR